MQVANKKMVILMNKYPKEFESAKKFANKIHSYLPNTTVYLFGSYAKDCPRDTSDIDIGIISEDVSYLGKENYINTLNRIDRDAFNIDRRIEPHLVSKKHDMADFSGVIENTGILIA